MTKPKPAAVQLRKTLEEIEFLIGQLEAEPWDRYDPTIAGACNRLALTAKSELWKIAKAICRVEPEETRPGPAGEPWYDGVLDNMR